METKRKPIHPRWYFIPALLLLFCLQTLGKDIWPDTLRAHKLYTDALLKNEQGELREAIELFGEAATQYKKKRAWERGIQCHLMEIRARIMNADDEGLVDFCREILDLSEKKLGSFHPVTGACFNTLGELYLYAHSHDMAGKSFQTALNIYSNGLSPDSLSIAKVYSNLGLLKMNLSQYDSAAIFTGEALKIQLGVLDSLDLRLLRTYNTSGVLQYYLGNMDRAIYYFNQTLQIRLNEYGADHYEVADSYNNLGSAYEKKKEYHKAVELHQNALNIRRIALDSLHPNIALSLNNLANAWYGLGEYDKSNQYHFEALRLRKKIYGDNHPAVAMSYANIGHNLVLQDNPDKATYYFKKVIPVMIELYGTDHLLTSDAYANLGLPFYYAGEYDSAFYYLNKALKIREKIQAGDNLSVARSYNNIGAIYKENRDYELALSYYEKSAEIYIRLLGENCNPLSGSFNNMGEVYLELGELDKSYEYFRKSLEIDAANLGPDNPRLASRYLNLGAAAAELGKHTESLAHHKTALNLHTRAYGENNRLSSSIYSNLATDYMQMDSLDMALKYLDRAINILHKFYGKPHFSLSSLYTKRGELFMEMGEKDKAISDLYQGLSFNYKGNIDPNHPELINYDQIIDKNQFIESLRAIIEFNNISTSENSKRELLSKNLVLYQIIADISIKLRETYSLERSKLQALQKWDFLYLEAFETAVSLYELTGEKHYFHQAFRFAGLKKAKALSDAILMAQAMENSSLPDSIIRLEKSLQSRLEGSRQDLLELDHSAENDEKSTSIENEINRLNIKLNELYLFIEKNYPDYKELLSSYPLYMPEEIGDMMSQGTIMVDFVVSDSMIYFLVLGKKDKWIEKTSLPEDFASKVNNLLKSVKKYRAKTFIDYSKEVYDVILNPLEKYFTGVEKIILIPDQYLLLLPFDILIKKNDSQSMAERDAYKLASQDYFIKRFETVSHYSADLWVRSHLSPATGSKGEANSGFLGFAPVFDQAEQKGESVNGDQNLLANDSIFTQRDAVDRMSLKELPYSEVEVDSLVSLFTRHGINAKALLRDQATEEMFRASMENYRYIHIATHGLINPEKPELSGLVFWKEESMQKDQIPQLSIAEKENDGVIYTKEVFNLKMHADLVTLSACETGAGLLAKGEGLLSFVRGFTYAGIPNLLISLWKVNDKTTADFMMDFYQGVLSGHSYPAALRKAKLKAISNEASSFPALWGNFVLIGH